MSKLTTMELYQILYSHYGPQDWWPGEGFEIAIGAILTQNTSWKNVEKAIDNLRENDLLEPEKIIACPDDLLIQLIKPSGFFNQKSCYLKNISELWIRNRHPNRDELLSVKGIGQETADSILLYLFQKPEFVIDAYTIRISNRLGLHHSKNKQLLKNFYQKSLPKSVQIFNEFHALFVIHGKTTCLKRKPKCNECILSTKCNWVNNTIQD